MKTTKYMLGFVWRDQKGRVYILLKAVTALLNALFPLSYVVFPGLIINELSGAQRIGTIVLYVGLLVSLPLIKKLIDREAEKHVYKRKMELDLQYELEFFSYTAGMDYEMLENPDINVMKERARQTIGGVLGVTDQISTLLSSVIGLLAISSIIATLNPLLILLIVAITYINSRFTRRINDRQFKLGQELSRYDRENWSHMWMLEQFQYAKEMRLFNFKSMLLNLYRVGFEKTNAGNLVYSMNGQNVALFTVAANFLQQICLYAYVIWRVLARGLEIGSMTIYMSVATQFSGSLGQVFSSYLQLSKVSLNIQELQEFMAMPSRHGKGGLTPNFDRDSVIEFKNVSFKYPGSENYALRNLNLTVRGDEKLCIVGANGSGKSTFIKLLTGLYLPEDGEILLNGVNVGKYDYTQYQRLFAPVFQDFQRYHLTLGENIVLASEYDETRLREVVRQVGLSALVAKLPKGLNTQVEKIVDAEGFIPSGGEEQRIAIARALYHGAAIYLLDEPTAALDPLAEYEIYTQFSEMISGKTAVLITHRLSAVQLADKVAVFDGGALVEYGTHKSLYADGALYTDMFNKQAEFYIEKAQSEGETVK
ncbi:MAG: ABC transporter ATP-binding protein/permease [Oscillospiraceae bacterium]|nr:ABC transporter ATP-binding protein/permease [Oscillospiraceae bacterium]